MHALTSLNRFQPGRRFSTWLFQIALNQCRDLARRGQVRSRFRAVSGGTQNEQVWRSAEEETEATMVLDAIKEMPVLHREVLILRYYNGFSEAETSEILGCPRGTVKSRLHEAVKIIRHRLDPGEEET